MTSKESNAKLTRSPARVGGVHPDMMRLDWLDQNGYAKGFEDMHEANVWTVEGPYSTVRQAIDAALAEQASGKGEL